MNKPEEKPIDNPNKSLIKILALEDPVILVLLTVIINKKIYHIESTSNAQTALDLIKKDNFSIIIADAENPLFNEIVQEAIDRNIPIIAMTEFEIQRLEKKFPSIHIFFIQKPFVLDTFYKALRFAESR